MSTTTIPDLDRVSAAQRRHLDAWSLQRGFGPWRAGSGVMMEYVREHQEGEEFVRLHSEKVGRWEASCSVDLTHDGFRVRAEEGAQGVYGTEPEVLMYRYLALCVEVLLGRATG